MTTAKLDPLSAHFAQKSREVGHQLSRQEALTDILADIHDAQTVAHVAEETWEQHESFVGVLDLLQHKLQSIEGGVTAFLDATPAPAGKKRPLG